MLMLGGIILLSVKRLLVRDSSNGFPCGKNLSGALFFGSLHCSGYDFVELLAMKLAVDVFIEAGWVGVMELVLESNSRMVLNWINNPIAQPR
ncbi:hypothetical protein V6N12_023421 [Hibiscus sabdariffa]|uniref:RNase H type-1 domain-containing protein n=1 Tax=Hibiscus sabdariffa TaxID=183260 RepID=A0ABR2FXT2_9ROSI